MGIGLSLTATVILPVWLGHRLDVRFGTEPLWFLVGAAFGLLGAFYQLFKVYKAVTERKR